LSRNIGKELPFYAV